MPKKESTIVDVFAYIDRKRHEMLSIPTHMFKIEKDSNRMKPTKAKYGIQSIPVDMKSFENFIERALNEADEVRKKNKILEQLRKLYERVKGIK